MQAWRRDRRWLRGFDLITLTAGSSKLLGLHSDTVAEGCRSYAIRGAPFRTWRLKWRSRKLKVRSCRVAGDTILFLGRRYRFGCLDRLMGSRKLGVSRKTLVGLGT